MYKKYSADYIEKNYSLIPVRGKKPFFNHWSKYSEEIPSDDDVNYWNDSFGDSNLGLVTGKASGVIAIDIDVDDPFVLNILAPSIVRRRGQKGEVRFYQFRDDIKSCKIRDTNDKAIVEVFANTGQVVLPGSIHPDTGKPYVWITQDTLLTVDKEELPELDPEQLKTALAAVKERYSKVEKQKLKGKGGRHDQLLGMCFAAIHNDETDEMIEKNLVDYDRKNHKLPYFDDPKENMSVERFIASARNTLGKPNPNVYTLPNISKAASNFEDKKGKELTEIANELDETLDSELIQRHPLPIPQKGLLNLIYKGIRHMDYKDNTPIAVATAHAILNTIFAHRFCINRRPDDPMKPNAKKIKDLQIWPHGYYLTIAQSGWGKSFGPRFLEDTIQKNVKELRSIEVLEGAGSHQGLVRQLSETPICMVISEEIGGLFKTTSEGQRRNFNSIGNVLCDIFSKAYRSVKLGVTKEIKKEEPGGKIEARYPALTILGFITEKDFKTSVSNELVTMGLIPRFRIFDCYDYARSDERVGLSEEELFQLISTLSIIASRVNILKGRNVALEDKDLTTDKGSLGLSYEDDDVVPHEIELTDDIETEIEKIQLWSDDLMARLPNDHPTQSFLNRAVEHTLLTAMDYELSMFDWHDMNMVEYFFVADKNQRKKHTKDVISLSHEALKYGFDMYLYSLYTFHNRTKGLGTGDQWEALENKILELLEKVGPKGLLIGAIGQKIRDKNRHTCIQMLLNESRVVMFTKGKRKKLVLAKHAQGFKKLNPDFTQA